MPIRCRNRSLWPQGHAAPRRYAVLDGISPDYPPATGRSHTRYSPVRRSPAARIAPRPDAPRLACVRPVASVHPEPGSNSPLLVCLFYFFLYCVRNLAQSARFNGVELTRDILSQCSCTTCLFKICQCSQMLYAAFQTACHKQQFLWRKCFAKLSQIFQCCKSLTTFSHLKTSFRFSLSSRPLSDERHFSKASAKL